MLRTRVFLITLGLFASGLTAEPAAGQTAAPGDFGFTASATGTGLYVGALPPDFGHAAVRAGFSGAAMSAAGQVGAVFDELGGKVATGGAGRHAEARARGLDVNGLVVAGAAEAGAPPTPAPVAAEASLVNIPDVASLSLARGEAVPVWNDHTCVAGRPLGFGSGRALGVVLPVAAIDAVRSQSITQLRRLGDTFSVVAEAHQAASTIHLLPGTPEQTTVELLGETVLRARADGNPGGAALEYAAVGTDPSAPFVRITRGSEVVQFTSQQVFSGGVALAQTPVMEIWIGEAPRGFDQAGGARPYVGADGTAASAVADLVRVQLLTGGGTEALDVRIGHLEAEVAVPAGGLRCPVPVSNELDKEPADRGAPAKLPAADPGTVAGGGVRSGLAVRRAETLSGPRSRPGDVGRPTTGAGGPAPRRTGKPGPPLLNGVAARRSVGDRRWSDQRGNRPANDPFLPGDTGTGPGPQAGRWSASPRPSPPPVAGRFIGCP